LCVTISPLDRTRKWFNENSVRQEVPLLSFYSESGEQISLRYKAMWNYLRYFLGSGYSVCSEVQNINFWCDDWFDRVVELYWERLLSEQYQGSTTNLPSLCLLSQPQRLDDLRDQDFIENIMPCLHSLGVQ
jgi:hypothetical protein